MKPLLRSHPVNILENTSRYLILLLLPLLRALLFSRMGFAEWLAGAWFDLLVLAAILALGVIRWYSYTFQLRADGIRIRRGVFLRQERFLPFANITVISAREPWYYRPIRAVRLSADTDGGRASQPDFSITVRRELARTIADAACRELIPRRSFRRVYIPRNLYILFFSFLTSNSLTGVLYLWAALSQAENIFGAPFRSELLHTFTTLAEWYSFGLPPLFAILAYAILGCWLVSFLQNMLRHLRFSTVRYGGALQITSGVFSRQRHTVAVGRINFLTLRQSLFSKALGLMSVFIHCTGYGKHQDELAVLLPSGRQRESLTNLELLLPEIPLAKRTLRPRLRYLSRFLIPPLTLCLAVLAAGLAALWFVTGFDQPLIFVLVICEIPCLWWLVVKIFAFFHTGIGVSEQTLTLYYTRAYQVITCSIPLDKITKISFQQTMFQRPTQCCDLIVYTWGEGIRRQRVINLFLPDAVRLLGLEEAAGPETEPPDEDHPPESEPPAKPGA